MVICARGPYGFAGLPPGSYRVAGLGHYPATGRRLAEEKSTAKLESWNVTETESPEIFLGMYPFRAEHADGGLQASWAKAGLGLQALAA